MLATSRCGLDGSDGDIEDRSRSLSRLGDRRQQSMSQRTERPPTAIVDQIYDDPADLSEEGRRLGCKTGQNLFGNGSVRPHFIVQRPFTYTPGLDHRRPQRQRRQQNEVSVEHGQQRLDDQPTIYDRPLPEYDQPFLRQRVPSSQPDAYADSSMFQRQTSQCHVAAERRRHSAPVHPNGRPMAVGRPPIRGTRQSSTSQSRIRPGSLLVVHRTRNFQYDHWLVYIGNGLGVHLVGAEELETREWTLKAFLKSLFGGEEYFGVHVDKLSTIVGRNEISIGDYFEEHAFLGEPYPPQTIIERALSLVGQRGYDPVWNNSEQFATWTRYGRSYSEQSGQWFRSLPAGSLLAETRLRVDELTSQHDPTERFDWVGVFTDPAALQRFKFLGSFAEVKSSKDISMRLKDTDEEATSYSSRDPAQYHIDFVAGSTSGWLAIQRKTRNNDGPSRTSSWKLKRFSEPELEDTMVALKEYHSKILSEGRAIRQITASGNVIVVVTGPLLSSESVSLCTATSVEGMAAFAEKGWRRSSPRYVYTSVYFNGYFLAVASNSVRLEDQIVFWAENFPFATIQAHADSGYILSCLAAGPVWAVFLDKSRYCNHVRQTMLTVPCGGRFPKRQLKAMWRSGLVVTAAAGN